MTASSSLRVFDRGTQVETTRGKWDVCQCRGRYNDGELVIAALIISTTVCVYPPPLHRSAAIHSSGHFQNHGRRNIWKVGQSRAPSSRSPRGGRRTSIIIIVLIWSWSWGWAGVDLSFDSSLGGSLGRVLWPRPLVPHCPMVPGPRLSAVYTFTLSDQIWHSIRRGKVGTFIGRIKGSAGLLLAWPWPDRVMTVV